MKQKILLVAAAIMCCIHCNAKPKEPDSYNYRRGVESAKELKTDEAIRYLNREIDDNPKNGYALTWLASSYIKKSEAGTALYYLESAFKYLPKSDKYYCAWAHSLKCEILLQTQDTIGALAEISHAIKIQPQKGDWVFQRSQIYRDNNQLDLSNADRQKYITLSPGIIRGNIALGKNYMEQKRHEEALQQFETAHKLATRSYTYGLMAQAQVKLHKYEDAATNCIEALKLDIRCDEAGDAIMDCKAPEFVELMLPLLDMQIEKHPNESDWFAAKAAILFAAKRYIEAVDVFLQMKQLDADFYIDGMLAGLYSKLGEYQKALTSINLLIEADSTDVKAYSMRMDIYYDMDSVDLALADAYKITKLAPDDADALSESAQMYFFAGHYRRAILECNKILALQPTYNYFRYLRGRSYLALGEQPSFANEDFNRACKESTRGMTKAFSLCFLDRFDEARIIVDSVCIADSINHDDRYNAACAYALMGDSTKAFQLLEEELKDGYSRFNHIRHDPDFASLHGTRFDSLLITYEAKLPGLQATAVTDSVETTTLRVVEVPFTSSNGVTKVDCTINGLPLNFIFDTGASDVSISQTEASFMFKNGYLSQRDVIGKKLFRTADGRISVGTTFILNHINFGGLELTGVRASVVGNQKAPLLLGQTVLKRLGKIEIDNERRVLKITTNQ